LHATWLSGWDDPSDLRLGDAQALEFKAASFDTVVST
jgi:ubiquinone/menaquinone biosynthesis C-methylase UbiE